MKISEEKNLLLKDRKYILFLFALLFAAVAGKTPTCEKVVVNKPTQIVLSACEITLFDLCPRTGVNISVESENHVRPNHRITPADIVYPRNVSVQTFHQSQYSFLLSKEPFGSYDIFELRRMRI